MAYQVEFIARLKDEVTAKLKGMTGQLKEFSGVMKESFVSGVRSALPDELGFIADKLEALPIAATAAAGAFVAVGSAAVAMASEVASTAIEFDKLSQKTGASVEFLSTFDAVARDAELSTQDVNTALTMFSRRLVETQGAGANVQQTLYALSDQFKNMADGPEKTALAMEYFGRAGAQMIPLLNQGSEALKGFQANAAEMGRVITTDTVAAAQRFDDAMDQIGGRLEGMKNSIGGAVLPAIADFLTGVDAAFGSVMTFVSALGQLASTGSVSALTMAQLAKAQYDVLTALSYVNPAMMASRGLFQQQADVAQKNIDALTKVGSAGYVAKGGFDAAGNGAEGSIPKFLGAGDAALTAAQMMETGIKRLQAMGGYYVQTGQLFKTTQDKIVFAQDMVASNFAANQRKMIADQKARDAAAAEAAIVDRDSNLARAESNTELNTTIESINVSLDKQMGLLAGGGGAAAAAKDQIAGLNEEMAKLEERQKTIGGYLGSNTEAMNAQQKVSTAYAIATGQLSTEQFAQEEAIKAVMQGLQDKKVSEEQAVTTALALAQGYVSAGDAIAVAGDSGKRFAEEIAAVSGIANSAKTKVDEMGLAIKAVPKDVAVDVVATILGMDDLVRAKDIVEKLDQHERHTITYNVIYRVSQYGAPPAGAPPPGSDPNGGAGGGGGGGGGGHDTSGASGASVYAGQTVRVGELGPELFVPSQNGVIVPNHKSDNGDNITINVYTSDPEAAARAVARKLKRG